MPLCFCDLLLHLNHVIGYAPSGLALVLPCLFLGQSAVLCRNRVVCNILYNLPYPLEISFLKLPA